MNQADRDEKAAKAFAKKLASNVLEERMAHLEKLRKYFGKLTSPKHSAMLKMWKGLFYDKRPVQNELAMNLAALMEAFPNEDGRVRYFSAALETFVREWPGIDFLRISKFFGLSKQMYKRMLVHMKENNWDESIMAPYLDALVDYGYSEKAWGLFVNFVEDGPDLLREVLQLPPGAPIDIPIAAALQLMAPTVRVIGQSGNTVVRKKCVQHLRAHLFLEDDDGIPCHGHLLGPMSELLFATASAREGLKEDCRGALFRLHKETAKEAEKYEELLEALVNAEEEDEEQDDRSDEEGESSGSDENTSSEGKNERTDKDEKTGSESNDGANGDGDGDGHEKEVDDQPRSTRTRRTRQKTGAQESVPSRATRRKQQQEAMEVEEAHDKEADSALASAKTPARAGRKRGRSGAGTESSAKRRKVESDTPSERSTRRGRGRAAVEAPNQDTPEPPAVLNEPVLGGDAENKVDETPRRSTRLRRTRHAGGDEPDQNPTPLTRRSRRG